MGQKGGSRGQSQVIGAVLIFGFIIAALGAAQIVLVPQANEEVEFNHNERAQQDMQEVRSAVQRSAAVGASQSESVELAANYPTRFLLLNPSEGAGTIRTADRGSIVIENATATDDEVADFWNGTGVDATNKRLVYTPNYNYYENAPETVYENSVLYNSFSDGTNVTESGQDLVNGRQIYLTALTGNKSTSQEEVSSVDVRAVSPATEKINVQADSGPINVTIPTQISEEIWVQELLADEIDDSDDPADPRTCDDVDSSPAPTNGRFVIGCNYNDSTSPNELTLTFQETSNGGPVTYSLKMAKLGVGSGVTAPDASYVTAVRGDGASTSSTQATDLTLQVRDKFNNPKSGTEVIFDTSAGNLDDQSVQTNEDGEATTTFDPDIVSGEAVVVGGIDTTGDGSLADEAAVDKAEFRIEVGDTFNGSGGIGNNLNPSGPVLLTSAERIGSSCSGSTSNNMSGSMGGNMGGGSCNANITLKNNASEDLTISRMRINYYDAQSPGASASDRVGSAMVTDDNSGAEVLDIQADYEDVNLEPIPSGDTQVYTFEFDENNGDAHEVAPGDFYVVSIIYEDPDTGEEVSSFTYFVAPV